MKAEKSQNTVHQEEEKSIMMIMARAEIVTVCIDKSGHLNGDDSMWPFDFAEKHS